MTLLFAGFDTTSIALTWTFYLLAKHPEVEAKVLAEISSVLGSGTGPTDKLTYETAGQLTYCAAVINEATRLYPPRH